MSDESGQPEVYVRPFPDVATAKWQVSYQRRHRAAVGANGRELFYLNGKSEMTSLPVRAGAGLRRGPAEAAFLGGPVRARRQRGRVRRDARRPAVRDGAAGDGGGGIGAGGGAELVRGIRGRVGK